MIYSVRKIWNLITCKLFKTNIVKYVKLYLKLSAIYLPLTLYGVYQQLLDNVSVKKAVFRMIKNYILVGEQFYSWPLWYLLATIIGLAALLVVPERRSWRGRNIYSDIKALHFSCPNIVSPSAFISQYASIGCGCVILNNAVIQNGAMVGNGVLVNSGVEIGHDSSVDDNSIVYANSVIRTGAKVGKRAMIGSNVTIGNNVLVPDDADVKNGMVLE